ncbi:hypothetical protein M1615_01495 [Patescibacteria group bacterium]|nr:hypothetical protein [Patescibacteria group bacterium]MCL5010261.1 hypothetical protein [Patescibacteria group bacterium]
MPSLKKVKSEAWIYYNKWRKEKTHAPAFKSEVRVSLMGWRHISGAAGYKKRPLHDTYRRLKLLPYAKEIIEKSTTIQNITTKGKRTFYALEAMIMVKEDRKEDLRKVRVILVEDAKGNKIFYSVMDKKQKGKKMQKSGTPHA